MNSRFVVWPITDRDGIVRLYVEAPGLRFEGSGALQPALVASAAGREKSAVRAVCFMVRWRGGR